MQYLGGHVNTRRVLRGTLLPPFSLRHKYGKSHVILPAPLETGTQKCKIWMFALVQFLITTNQEHSFNSALQNETVHKSDYISSSLNFHRTKCEPDWYSLYRAVLTLPQWETIFQWKLYTFFISIAIKIHEFLAHFYAYFTQRLHSLLASWIISTVLFLKFV